MWKIINYLPGVIEQAKSRGYENNIPVFVFKAEIKRSTGVMCDKTLAGWLKTLNELGYIRSNGTGIIEVCSDLNKPYVFISDKQDG